MPKTKATKGSTSDSDSGPNDRNPVKKAKTARPGTPAPKSRSDGDEDSWEIGRNRFVKLTEFNGKWYINIREYYNADGDLKPSKKGIMLSLEQWQKLKTCVPDVEAAIKKRV